MSASSGIRVRLQRRHNYMHSLAPLLFILILFNRQQLKTDNLYRANVFALVGVSYFFLLQYTIYWYQIFPSQNLLQYAPGFIVVLFTVGIALSPWNKRSNAIKTLILCGLSATTLVATFALDKPIKENLAEIGGFFKQDVSSDQNSVIPYDSKAVELPEIGIRLDAPLDWQQHQLPSGHTYFTYSSMDRTLMEIRPNCLGALGIDTPTYLLNVLTLFEANKSRTSTDYTCTQHGSIKTCFVRVTYPQPSLIKEKWHWIKIPEDRSRSIGIDFLIHENVEEQYAEIWNVIASIEHLGANATEPCRTPATWL
jgi:hypothetical protein